jgi:hypothetical protein
VLSIAAAAASPAARPRRRPIARLLRQAWRILNAELPADSLAAGPGRDL